VQLRWVDQGSGNDQAFARVNDAEIGCISCCHIQSGAYCALCGVQ
jgi:hypothetical protein